MEESGADGLLLRRCSREGPYYALNAQCFPPQKNHQVAPWLKDKVFGSLTRLYVQECIDQDKPKYVRMVDERFGNRKAFMGTDAAPADQAKLQKLFGDISDDAGNFSAFKLAEANAALSMNGSSVRVDLWTGAGIILSERYGIPIDKL